VEGLQVTELTPDGAFDRAGIVPGDLVTRLARERTKNMGDLLDGLHNAIREETYEVEFQRGSEKMKLNVAREFRPAVIEALPEPVEVFVETTPSAQIVAPISVADELAKFAKLRDDGIISEEEFEAQKLRLLAD
jgi:C-terminal processing protease CtpA/Prc